MSRTRNAVSRELPMHDENSAHFTRGMAVAFFTKALSRAYAFRTCEAV
jgi:hypothetical protein